jgi:ABC-type polysaccharide/polyol phosphate transport system ATPase subunit
MTRNDALPPAIRVSSLSKEFVLGEREPYFTLRETIQSLFRMPKRREGDRDGDAKRLCALKDVSFEIAQGEVVGIIGHNGAGKSTLLKILSRITEPSQGEVELFGRVSSLLEVGTGFHPELTGRENIYLNGSILGMRWREINAKFDEIVAFSGVERFLDTPTKRYSTGMQVRLAFAVAAHLEPEILLVDEVLAVGDAEFQKKCLGKMSDVARSGRTVLFVSHNMAAIRRLCGRAILLEHGALREFGDASTVIDAYLSRTPQTEWRDKAHMPDVKNGISILSLASRRENDDLHLLIEFTNHTSKPKIGIGINVRGQDGTLLSSLKPYKTRLVVPGSRTRFAGSIILSGFFKLMTAGPYTFDLWFADPGIEQIRRVERALSVEVPINDRFHSGHSLTQTEDGFIALDARLEEHTRELA